MGVRRRREFASAPIAWAPACGDLTARQIVANSLRSACGLVGARGGFLIVLREQRQLDIIAAHALTPREVLDLALGLAAPALHRVLLEPDDRDADPPDTAAELLAVPVKLGMQNRGALCLWRDAAPRALGALEIEILDALAGQAALALAADSQRDALTQLHAHLNRCRD